MKKNQNNSEYAVAILGNAFYSTSFDDVKFMKDAIICIDASGVIADVVEFGAPNYDEKKAALLQKGILRQLKEDEFILPGFIDLHIHAPQFPQSAMALDKPLEQWLQDYTFPLEAKYADVEFAKKVYHQLVKSTLKFGTTSAFYFATVHLEASLELAKICSKLGQRGFVGKVVMDDLEQNPEFYRDKSTQSAIDDTRTFIEEVLKIQNDCPQKVYPVVTPRFIPSCTDRALDELGNLAKEYDVHIQTHCSESDWQHQFSKDRFGISDAHALDKFGLLTDKTVLAHSVFPDDDDVNLFVKRDISIAHCPLSNAYFADAVLPFKHFHEAGVNIGAGTDISGGYATSMYNAIRQTVISARMLNAGTNPSLSREKRGASNSMITLNNAFYAATVAGGHALKLPLGKFEAGYIADFQVLDLEGLPVFGKLGEDLSPQSILDKLLLLSESVNIKEVWVQGRQVKGL